MEGVAPFFKGAQKRGGKAIVGLRIIGAQDVEDGQLIGVGNGERTQQEGVDQGKDGGVGAEAEGEREDRGQGESGGAVKLAQAVAEVAGDAIEDGEAAALAVGFLYLREAAEAAQGGDSRLLPIHPSGDVFSRGEVDVGAQFFVERGV